MSRRPSLIVAGAGIGGLAAAIALGRRGFPVRALERDEPGNGEGAGIQIGPNGMRVLASLGVARDLAALAVRPDHLNLIHGRTGWRLAELPLGAWLENRHGAPYCLFNRADLAGALLARARAEPLISMEPGFEVASVEVRPARLAVRSSRGAIAEGDAVIGADGLWSAVRGAVPGAAEPRAIGWTAARTLIAASGAPPQFSAPAVSVWLTPDAHVVHYPVRASSEIAVVVVTRGAGTPAPGRSGGFQESVPGLSPALHEFLALGTGWRHWPLHAAKRSGRRTSSRIALLGDAAHPLLPYLAQGGSMALEDAVVLASAVAGTDDLTAAFALYERLRLPRVQRVAHASLRNGAIYHLGPPLSWARDGVLRASNPNRLMASLDWLYEYDAFAHVA